MIIYCIKNKITDDFYISKTKHSVEYRWKQHLRDMKHCKTRSKLYNAIKKYGPDSFEYYLFEDVGEEEDINEREKYWIEALDPAYNIARGGNGGLIGTGQLGRRWKIKDTSNMKKTKTKTTKVLEGYKKISGANNYQSRYNIHTPWGTFNTWLDVVKGARLAKSEGKISISNIQTIKKYCEKDQILSPTGKRIPKEWRNVSTRTLGFYMEKAIMNVINYTEIFYSLQGEGQYVGVPSIFLRTFGCNLRCRKFGISRDQEVGDINPEVQKILDEGLDKYNTYEELPLVTTGCDTYASVYPEFKKFAKRGTVGAIVNEFEKLLPDGKFSTDKHLIITGGEPLLGWQKSFPTLLEEIETRNMGLTHLTFETNGTKHLTSELHQYLQTLAVKGKLEVTFSISAKLPGSGEKWKTAIRPDVVSTYMRIANHKSYFKFVVSSKEDIEDAKRAVDEYKAAGVNIPVYLMPVGGVNAVYEMNERAVADFCRDNGFRFSPRIQVPLYKNQWGT